MNSLIECSPIQTISTVIKAARGNIAPFFAVKPQTKTAAFPQANVASSSQAIESATYVVESGSELSDLDSEDIAETTLPAKPQKQPLSSSLKVQPTMHLTANGNSKKKAKITGGKAEEIRVRGNPTTSTVSQHGGKAKEDVQDGIPEKKPRPKPVKKPEIPIEPPEFEKVDTRLSWEEAEQRMAVSKTPVKRRWLISAVSRVYRSISIGLIHTRTILERLRRFRSRFDRSERAALYGCHAGYHQR